MQETLRTVQRLFPIVYVTFCFVQQIFAMSIEIVKKPNKCKSFLAPIFREVRSQFLYSRLLAGPAVHRLAKFGRVPFADPRLQSLAMKWNAEFTEGG